MWYPVTIYAVLLLGQRLQIGPVPLVPFALGLVMSCGYFPYTLPPACYELRLVT